MTPPPPRATETKKPFVKALGESVSYGRRALEIVWRSSPRLTLALAALTLVASAVPPAIAWAGKGIVDSVVARSRDATIRWVAVEFGLVVLQATLTRGLMLTRSVLGSRLGTDVNVAILERSIGLE